MLSQKAIYRWRPTTIYLWEGCGAGVSYGISIDDLDQRWICINKFSILPLGPAEYFILNLLSFAVQNQNCGFDNKWYEILYYPPYVFNVDL